MRRFTPARLVPRVAIALVGLAMLLLTAPTAGQVTVIPGAGRAVLWIAGSDPAAGVEATVTTFLNAQSGPASILSVSVQLVTDATVANREVVLIVDDGSTTVFASIPSGVTQVASQTRRYTFGLALPRGAGAQSLDVVAPLPPVAVFNGWRVRTSTVGLQAGDNFGPMTVLVSKP